MSFQTQIQISTAAAAAAKNLLGAALRAVVKNGEDEEGNDYELDEIESVIEALEEADRILISDAPADD